MEFFTDGDSQFATGLSAHRSHSGFWLLYKKGDPFLPDGDSGREEDIKDGLCENGRIDDLISGFTLKWSLTGKHKKLFFLHQKHKS